MTQVIQQTKLPESKKLPLNDPYGEDTTARVKKLILNSLRYQEMNHRYEKIPLPYKQTFQWIYKKKDIADFPAWLRDNHAPFYWITGKPGAGKSTLMKYLVDNPRTEELLVQDSSNKSVIMASAYLWNSGTQKQMSYEGLLRSLLYQMLRAKPNLMHTVFPHWFEAGVLLGDRVAEASNMVWVWEELYKVFRTVLDEAAKAYKLVFFIDGLDEYIGKSSEIIAFVSTLTSSGAKVCASSRQWVQFEDAYRDYPHLRVQDLTVGDIAYYVDSNLRKNAGFKEMEALHDGACLSLIYNVRKKSSGVFLWVVLVTNSLFEGLTCGENAIELQERLDALPEDLENLFWKILESLDKRSFPRACQLFMLKWQSKTHLTILDMSFAHDIDGDDDFALREAFGEWNGARKAARADTMRRRLTAFCKGLLEANPSTWQETWEAEIGYLHRTVRDYLSRPDVWSKVCTGAGSDFNHCTGLFNAQLMRLKVSTDRRTTASAITRTMKFAISYAGQAEQDGSARQVKMLDELDISVGKATERTMTKADTKANGYESDETLIDSWRTREADQPWSFLKLAVQHRLLGYVNACLGTFPKEKVERIAIELLHVALDENMLSDSSPRTSNGDDIIHILLRHADPARFGPHGSGPPAGLITSKTARDFLLMRSQTNVQRSLRGPRKCPILADCEDSSACKHISDGEDSFSEPSGVHVLGSSHSRRTRSEWFKGGTIVKPLPFSLIGHPRGRNIVSDWDDEFF